MTQQEVKLWVRLRELRAQGFHFRQVPIDRFIVDFACLKHRLVIEVDGGQHGHDAHARRDEVRDSAFQVLGFRVLRFWNVDIDRALAGVVETILAVNAESAISTPGAARRSLPSGEG
jgi:very-short-patch-repair endonuclease